MRKTVFGVNCIMIAVENQNEISYAMPIRVLDGDAMEYTKQLRHVQMENKKNGEWESGQSLSDPCVRCL